MNPKHIRQSFVSDFSRNAREGHLEEIAEPMPILPKNTKFCRYIDKCNKFCFQNTKKYENCRVRKFYEKWEK